MGCHAGKKSPFLIFHPQESMRQSELRPAGSHWPPALSGWGRVAVRTVFGIVLYSLPPAWRGARAPRASGLRVGVRVVVGRWYPNEVRSVSRTTYAWNFNKYREPLL
eukprot:3961932-Prymnesium_polylepis.1